MSISRTNAEGYIDLTAYDALTNIEKTEQQIRRFMPVVFICSPYAGDTETNVQNARRYCRFAVEHGCVPIAPHLLFPQFMDDDSAPQRKLALHMNMILLGKCRELWAFGETITDGMQKEISRAQQQGKPVRRFTTDCKEVA